MASSLASEREALFLDTRTLRFERVPLPPGLQADVRHEVTAADTAAALGSGDLAVRGTVDLESEQMGYNLAAVARLFNANVVIARLPQTSLTATATARGRAPGRARPWRP